VPEVAPAARARAFPGLVAFLERHALGASVGLLALFAVLDRLSGVQITFVVLTYVLPIAIATWFHSRRAGLVIAALATTCTTWIFVTLNASPRPLAVMLDAVGAFGMFASIIWTLAALRRHVERERLQHRAAVDHLRHAERLNVIGTLAAGAAHELGTPLNLIAGAAEMLGEGEPTRPKVDRLTRLILEQTDRITAIVHHLLDFGRRAGTAVAEVELDRAVDGAVELLSSTARKHGVTISVAASAAPTPRVRGNRREIEQVVSNLLLNGIQAMPRGGELGVATRLEHRRDAGGTERTFAAIAVTDEGQGIAEADLPCIFDPFFTTKGVGEGTGLGLSVSYGIVRDCGGTIEVASTPGRGTTFVVLLPLARG
jgi:signal transduction histidine kinase